MALKQLILLTGFIWIAVSSVQAGEPRLSFTPHIGWSMRTDPVLLELNGQSRDLSQWYQEIWKGTGFPSYSEYEKGFSRFQIASFAIKQSIEKECPEKMDAIRADTHNFHAFGQLSPVSKRCAILWKNIYESLSTLKKIDSKEWHIKKGVHRDCNDWSYVQSVSSRYSLSATVRPKYCGILPEEPVSLPIDLKLVKPLTATAQAWSQSEKANSSEKSASYANGFASLALYDMARGLVDFARTQTTASKPHLEKQLQELQKKRDELCQGYEKRLKDPRRGPREIVYPDVPCGNAISQLKDHREMMDTGKEFLDDISLRLSLSDEGIQNSKYVIQQFMDHYPESVRQVFSRIKNQVGNSALIAPLEREMCLADSAAEPLPKWLDSSARFLDKLKWITALIPGGVGIAANAVTAATLAGVDLIESQNLNVDAQVLQSLGVDEKKVQSLYEEASGKKWSALSNTAQLAATVGVVRYLQAKKLSAFFRPVKRMTLPQLLRSDLSRIDKLYTFLRRPYSILLGTNKEATMLSGVIMGSQTYPYVYDPIMRQTRRLLFKKTAAPKESLEFNAPGLEVLNDLQNLGYMSHKEIIAAAKRHETQFQNWVSGKSPLEKISQWQRAGWITAEDAKKLNQDLLKYYQSLRGSPELKAKQAGDFVREWSRGKIDPVAQDILSGTVFMPAVQIDSQSDVWLIQNLLNTRKNDPNTDRFLSLSGRVHYAVWVTLAKNGGQDPQGFNALLGAFERAFLSAKLEQETQPSARVQETMKEVLREPAKDLSNEQLEILLGQKGDASPEELKRLWDVAVDFSIQYPNLSSADVFARTKKAMSATIVKDAKLRELAASRDNEKFRYEFDAITEDYWEQLQKIYQP